MVTKIDLVESGSGMVEKLEGAGNNLKLKLGFIPVSAFGRKHQAFMSGHHMRQVPAID